LNQPGRMAGLNFFERMTEMTDERLTSEELIGKGLRDIEAQHRANVHTLMGEVGPLLIEARTENRKHRNYWDFNARYASAVKVDLLRQGYEKIKASIEKEIRAARAQHDPIFMKSVRDHLAECDQEFCSDPNLTNLPPTE
jgi:hypothetical protein